jgi:Flp pilus assembly protein CpaB
MMLSRSPLFNRPYLRSFILFLCSALLAFASVWIAEKEFTPVPSTNPVQLALVHPEETKIDSMGLSHKLAPGMRAMSVKVNEVAGVAGFALPGSLVDVLVNTQELSTSLGPNDHSVSKIILEKVLVLAVAQETSHEDKKPKVVNAVTLQVTPKQSELLDLARNVGSLSLVLRNPEDVAIVPSSGVTRHTLLAGTVLSTPPSHIHLTAQKVPQAQIEESALEQTNQKIELIKGTERVAFFSGTREPTR